MGEHDDHPTTAEAPTRREASAEAIEDRLDLPMAGLAVVWAVLTAYELVAPDSQRTTLFVASNTIWGLFVVEFATKLVVSGNPVVFLRRRWPSALFLVVPALRVFAVVRAVRVLRVLPAARVVGSSYRAIGTARSLLGDRLLLLGVVTSVVAFGGGQLFFVLEPDTAGSLGGALWWSSNAAVTGSLVVQPTGIPARLLSLALSTYAVVVFASLAATLGAYFVESRTERAVAEGDPPPS